MSIKLKVKTNRRDVEINIKDSSLDLIHYLDTKEVKYPFGCRSSSCGVCRAEIIEGSDLLESMSPTEEDTLKRCNALGSQRLMCRAKFKQNIDGILQIKSNEST